MRFLRQARIAGILDANVLLGMKRFGDPTGNRVHFDADEACTLPAVAHEVAGAAPQSQHDGIIADTYFIIDHVRVHSTRSRENLWRAAQGRKKEWPWPKCHPSSLPTLTTCTLTRKTPVLAGMRSKEG
jgi:hypothetical protein